MRAGTLKRAVFDAMVKSVDWGSLRSIDGESSHVPSSLLGLVLAQSESEADVQYWRLDNHVIVQGRLFEAAPYVVAPLMVALQSEISASARYRCVELLVEIALGVPHEDDQARGSGDVVILCRAELCKGIWVVYSLLEDPDWRIRIGAMDILEVVERNRALLQRCIHGAFLDETHAKVRSRADELLGALGRESGTFDQK